MTLNRFNSFTLLIALLLTLSTLGCIEARIFMSLEKKLPATLAFSKLYVDVRESVDVLVPAGNFSWSGRITNFTAPLPDNFHFLIEHRSKKGSVLESWTLDLPMDPSGTIPKTSAVFPGAQLKANERIRINWFSEENFSGGDLTLKFNYKAF